MHKARIGILDGFRAIAIIFVVLYHFFSLEGFPFPYGKKYDFFLQGKHGVDFFFIISGFVIFYTLENTASLKKFALNRFIRLYPSVFIASTLSLIIVFWATTESFASLLPKYLTSLSLIGTKLSNLFLMRRGQNVHYIDNSLWTLWPEVQFYVLAGGLYFLQKEKFLRNFVIAASIIITLWWLNSNVWGGNYFHLKQHGVIFGNLRFLLFSFNIAGHIQYFLLGILFYVLFKCVQKNEKPPVLVLFFIPVAIAVQMYFAIYPATRIANIFMDVIFFIFIYAPEWISFLDNRFLNAIGISSFFFYLIHQSIGLVLIERFGMDVFPTTFIFPLLLIITFIVVSIWYTYKIEKPLLRYLKRK